LFITASRSSQGRFLANEFRHPGPEDREPETSLSNGLPKWVSSMGNRARSAVGVIGGLIFFGLIGVAWAANIATCFRSAPASRQGDLVPREPRENDSLERRLVIRLANVSLSSGGSPDSGSVWVVDDSAINAASMGHGSFILWRGLGQLPDESLDVVYAHEIAHDQLGHAKKSAELADVTDFVGEALATASGSDVEAGATLKRWSGNFVIPRYSKQQELEADARAVTILSAQGYTKAASTVCIAFIDLRARVGEAGGGFFAEHPGLSDRIHAIAQRYPSTDTDRDCK